MSRKRRWGNCCDARTGFSAVPSHWYVGRPRARRYGTTTTGMATAAVANRAEIIMAGSALKILRKKRANIPKDTIYYTSLGEKTRGRSQRARAQGRRAARTRNQIICS